ncbi:hypothetical protein [Streptomyces sp. NPDC002172]
MVVNSTAPNGVFAALRVRDHRIYWSTGLVSSIGSAMQGVALDWFVLTLTRPRARKTRPVSRPPWTGAGAEGLRYVAARPELVGVFTVFGLSATFAVDFPTTLALFAGRVFDVGSRGLGLMNTALAVGTVAGTVAATRGVSPRVRTVVVGALLFGGFEARAGVMPTYAAFLALLLPAGFTLMTLNTAVSAFVRSEVSDAMRGRVMAVCTVISMGGSPVGAPVIGWISQHAGVRWGPGAGAATAVLAALGVALWLTRRSRSAPALVVSVVSSVAAASSAPPASAPPPPPPLPSVSSVSSVPATPPAPPGFRSAAAPAGRSPATDHQPSREQSTGGKPDD